MHSVEEMIEDGWSKQEVSRSIKAVQKLLKRRKFVVEAEGGNKFDVLFMPRELTL